MTRSRRQLMGHIAAIGVGVGTAGCGTVRSVFEPEYLTAYRTALDHYDRSLNQMEEGFIAGDADLWIKATDHFDIATRNAETAVEAFGRAATDAEQKNEMDIHDACTDAVSSAENLRQCTEVHWQNARVDSEYPEEDYFDAEGLLACYEIPDHEVTPIAEIEQMG